MRNLHVGQRVRLKMDYNSPQNNGYIPEGAIGYLEGWDMDMAGRDDKTLCTIKFYGFEFPVRAYIYRLQFSKGFCK